MPHSALWVITIPPSRSRCHSKIESNYAMISILARRTKHLSSLCKDNSKMYY
jgi:hypothetical protein